MLIEIVDADGGWWAAGRLFGGDDGDCVGRVGRAYFVLGYDSKVIGGGWPEIEHARYVLLGSGHQNSVDIGLPRAFADLVLDYVTLDRTVPVVRRCPGKLNRASRFVQHLQTVRNLGYLCEETL